jgi:hypothetical protein
MTIKLARARMRRQDSKAWAELAVAGEYDSSSVVRATLMARAARHGTGMSAACSQAMIGIAQSPSGSAVGQASAKVCGRPAPDLHLNLFLSDSTCTGQDEPKSE